MKVHTLFQQNKNLLRNSLDAGVMFCVSHCACANYLFVLREEVGSQPWLC